ncbi:MAG: DUF7948 domain-containing protein [Flavobacteriales bacterium]
MKNNLMRALTVVLMLYLHPLISRAGFVPNKGQVADKNGKPRPDVLFTFDTHDARLFFMKDRIVYALYKMDHVENDRSRELREKGDIEGAKYASLRIFEQRIDMEFKGALPEPGILFEDPQGERTNFYFAHCAQGITGVQAYGQVTYKNLYNGIDVVFKLVNGTLKYDLVLHPGAKLSDIRFRYDGVSSISKNGKNFEMKTEVRTLRESIPASYWQDDKKPVNVDYRLMEDNTFGFTAEGIETVDRTLVIDPTLAWATYFERSTTGASSAIRGNVTTDASGNFYYQINTYSPDLPVVNPGGGAWFDPSYNPSSGLDVYFAKFNVNRQLVWATYLGGTGSQNNYYDHGIAATGNTFYVSGVTSSTDFPLMNQGGGAYYQTSPGTGDKGFLSKFNSATGVMQHSTYLRCYSEINMAVDGNGNVAVSSFNYSWSTAPTVVARAGAYNDNTFNGNSDVFLYMFDANMVQTWGTWLGGTGYEEPMGITFDSNNNLYLFNRSDNATVPLVNPGGGAFFDNTYSDKYDYWLMKFNASGGLVWSTLLGGNGLEGLSYSQVTTNANNDVIFTSTTRSTVMNLVNPGGGAYYQTMPAGLSDGFGGTGYCAGFIMRFNSASALIHGTYMGANNEEVYIQGQTPGNCNQHYLMLQSRTFATTPQAGSYNVNNANTSQYGYMAMEMTPAFGIGWSSYIHSDSTFMERMVSDRVNGRLYATGMTQARDFPVTNPGGGAYYDNVINSGTGSSYVFGIVQFDIGGPPVLSVSGGGPATVCAGQSITLTATGSGTINWYNAPSGGTLLGTGTTLNYTPGVTTVYAEAVNGGCASTRTPITITVNPLPSTPNFTTNSPLCAGSTLNLNGPTVGGATYIWTGPNSFSSSVEDPSLTNITAAAAGTYNLRVVVSGCTSAVATQTVTVNAIPATPNFSTNSPVCAGSALNLNGPTVGGATYVWSGPNSFSSSLEDPSIGSATVAAGGTYNLYVVVNGCTSATATQAVTVNPLPATPNFTTNSPICAGSTLNLNGPTVAGATYLWTGPNSFSSSVEDPSISNATAAASGTYNLRVVVSGCSSAVATQTVTVNPIPATPNFTSNSPLCPGATLNLNGPTVAGATYVWTGPNSFGSSVEDPSISSVTAAASGTYNLYVVVSGCTSATATGAVTVNPTPAAPTFTTNSPICSGGNVSLDGPAIAGATYVWSGPNGFTASTEDAAVNNATVAASGVYSLYVVNSGCTSATATQTVTVNPTPATPNFTTNSPVCAGSTLNLNGPTVAGATYVWSGPNVFSSSVEDPSITNVTTAASGTYNLYVIVNGCNSVAATQTVTVNPLPATPNFTTNSPLCAGSTLNLNGPTVAGATYVWTGPNSFGSALEDPSISNVTVAAAGTYNLRVVVSGCSSAVATQNVVVNPIPATPNFTTNSPLCSGSALNLNGPTVAGATYVWSGPNSFSSSLEDPSIAGATTAASGTYNLTVVVSGCSSATATQAVTVNATPATPNFTSNTPVCTGNTLNLNGPTVAGATYVWSGPNSFGSSAEDPSIAGVSAAAAGTYSLVVVVNGCSSATATQAVVVNTTPATPSFTTNSPICSGSALNLSTATVSGASYVWTGPNSFSSGVQNPGIPSAGTAAAGTYNLVVVVSGCSSGVATQTVVVNPTPAITMGTFVNPNACGASTGSFSINGTGTGNVTWTGAASGAAVSVSLPYTISNVPAGSYAVTFVSAAGCSSNVLNTSLSDPNPPSTPLFTVSPAVCAGATLNFNGPTVAGATYVWTGPNSFGSSVEDPTLSSVTPAASGTYSLYIVVGGCTSATATQAVTVNPIPAAPAFTIGSPVCVGGSVTLDGPTIAGATYAWSGPAGFSSAAEDPILTGLTNGNTGSYSLTVTVNGCTSPATIQTVTVNALPVIGANASAQLVCTGSSVTLTGSGGVSYTWDNGVTNGIPFVPVATALYTVTGTAASGCSSTDTITVTVSATGGINLAIAVSDADTTVCAGSEITLTASGATSYLWVHNGASTAAVTVNPTTPTVYTVIGSAGVCSDSLQIAVDVLPVPNFSITVADNSICQGDSVELTAVGGIGAVLLWSTGSNLPSIWVSPSATTNYTLTATDNNSGCIDLNTVTIIVNPEPVINMQDSVLVCGNSQTTLNAGAGFSAYQWSTGATTSTLVVTQNGMYQVVVTDANGCTGTDASYVTISAYDPNAGATGETNVALCQQDNFIFAAEGGVAYSWTGPNNFSSTSASNEINNIGSNNAGDYIVTIYNKDNCTLQDTVTLSLLSDGECQTITELVTPNNDGKNDLLIIGFLDKYPDHKLTIYNRWGSPVYKAQPYANDWNGKANMGAVVGKDGYLPVGTYFYILETGTDDKPVKGFIELQY